MPNLISRLVAAAQMSPTKVQRPESRAVATHGDEVICVGEEDRQTAPEADKDGHCPSSP